MTFEEKRMNWLSTIEKHIHDNAVAKAIEELIPYAELEKHMDLTCWQIAEIFNVPSIVIVKAIEYYNGRDRHIKLEDK
jgi:hypothetical protein